MSAVVLTVAGPQHADRHAPGGADSLSGVYLTVAGSPASEALFPVPMMRGATIDSFIARPLGSDATRSPIEWIHDDGGGYLLHFTGGPNMSGAAAFIGLGVDKGGVGLFANNKKTGVGVKITNNDTITDALAHGLQVNASSTVAPGAWFGQGIANAKPAAVFTANVAAGASQRLVEWRITTSTSSDTLVGYVAADTGNLVWQKALSVSGADLTVQAATGVGGNIRGGSVGASGAAAYLDLYDTNGTANSRRFQISQSSGSFLITARDDVQGNKGTILQIDGTGTHTLPNGANFVLGTTTGTKIGTSATQKIGAFGATPIARPTGVAVTIEAVHAALVSLGWIAA